MATLDDRKLTLWVALVGCGGAGKRTTLERLRARLAGATALVAETTPRQQTLVWFDQPLGAWGPLEVWIKYLALSGMVFYDADREQIIRGSSGAILVFDRTPQRFQASIEAFQNLARHVASHQPDPSAFPVLVQLNKSDGKRATPVARARAALGLEHAPAVETAACCDRGLDELAELVHAELVPRAFTRMVEQELRARPQLAALYEGPISDSTADFLARLPRPLRPPAAR